MDNISILDHGAAPDTGKLCTDAVQAAFDEANGRGNGTVVIPRGEFVTGTVDMGGASLFLEKGAVLKGSPRLEDYRPCGYRHNEMGDVLPLLYSMNSDGVRVSGEGCIDLNGDAFFDFAHPVMPDAGFDLTEEQKLECTVPHKGRPNQPIFFYRCRNVSVSGIRIMNSPCWTVTFVEGENIRVTDLTIDNSLRIPNDDGMHFCSCRNVVIRGCVIRSGDDCIALSAITDWNKPCEDVVISDCNLQSCSKAIVAGYMHSIVRNVCISNVIIRESNRGICVMASERTGLVENVAVSNVRIDTRVRAGNWWGNGEPIHIMATWHHYDNYRDPPPERALGVNVRNIRVQGALCTAENAIGIVGVNGNIRCVDLVGLQVTLKDSANRGIKGKLVDMSPSPQTAMLPDDGDEYWLLVQGAGDVAVKDARVAPFHGKVPRACVRDCSSCAVETV